MNQQTCPCTWFDEVEQDDNLNVGPCVCGHDLDDHTEMSGCRAWIEVEP